MTSQELTEWSPSRGLLIAIRATLLLVCIALSAVVGVTAENAGAVLLLALTAVATSLPVQGAVTGRLQAVSGGVLAALVITLIAPAPTPLLPFLLAPVVSAGLLGGVVTAVTTAGLAAGAELSATIVTSTGSAVLNSVAVTSPWMLLTIAMGLLAAWVRHLQLRPPPSPDPVYASAYRLLAQLRPVSRQLSGGLDPVSLAAATLQRVDEALAPARLTCLVRPADHGHLVTLAAIGLGAHEWSAGLEDSPLVREAWVSSTSAFRMTGPRTRTVDAAVLPLLMGPRMFGVIVLEWDEAPPDRDRILRASAIAGEAALRLGTALLFSEIRAIATAEERRRVAREIHDGIAQELASLGYAIDDLAARSPASILPEMTALRAELSRVVSELRLSIFDLRSGVLDAGGLGTAVSDYVQRIGATSEMTVHLVLDEAGPRLPLAVEGELFRVVQEAVTNARRHANARNLWVTCHIHPPTAQITVEDDGTGMGSSRVDSFGLSVMHERAEHVGARLELQPRPGGGTRVTLELSGSAAADSALHASAVEGGA